RDLARRHHLVRRGGQGDERLEAREGELGLLVVLRAGVRGGRRPLVLASQQGGGAGRRPVGREDGGGGGQARAPFAGGRAVRGRGAAPGPGYSKIFPRPPRTGYRRRSSRITSFACTQGSSLRVSQTRTIWGMGR